MNIVFFDLFRKKLKNDTGKADIEQTHSVEPKIENANEFITTKSSVIVSESEYNPLDIISVFQYAIKKKWTMVICKTAY
jgi:hypothetical protein